MKCSWKSKKLHVVTKHSISWNTTWFKKHKKCNTLEKTKNSNIGSQNTLSLLTQILLILYDSFPSVVGRLECMHFLFQNLNNQQHAITLSDNKNSLEFNPEWTSYLRLHIWVLEKKERSLSSFILPSFMLMIM